MKIAQVQFAPWDKAYNVGSGVQDLAVGDKVIVKTELGVELGKVVGFEDIDLPDQEQNQDIKIVSRKATEGDLKKIPNEKQKKKDMEYCKKVISKFGLLMKLVDIHYSFDNSKITFAFVADSRIDFRELVKELTRYFNRAIRLQQIGIRDKAKIIGDFGHCGRQLCCRRFFNGITSITSEMAELQQCAHRGSERISGVCGRLMCCLAYEEAGYKKLYDCLPPINSEMIVKGKKGRVIKQHVLKQTVEVSLDNNKKDKDGSNEIIEIYAGKIGK